MILWLTAHATPQFTPVLNRLYNDEGLPLFAYYLWEGSGIRGWGEMDLQHPHTFHSAQGFLKDLRTGYLLARAPSLQAAVVFGYSKPVAMGLLFGCRRHGIQVFTQSDTDYDQQRNKPLLRRTLKAIALRVLYARSTRVWVIGESNARFWQAHGLINQRHIPFESPVPVPIAPVDAGFKSKTSSDTALVLYVGRLSPEKRVADAIFAVQMLRDKGVKVTLRLVGAGTLPLRLPDRYRDWLQICGAVPHDELARHYIEADVLVLPSESEPYGLVIREALQFGLPVVASTVVPAAKELCNVGWNLVPPRDPAALAVALKRAIDLPARWASRPPVDTAALYHEELSGLGRERSVAE